MTRDSRIADTLGVAADLPAWLQPPAVLSGRKRLALLGGTGSIGQSTLRVLRHDQVRPLETLGVGEACGAGRRFELYGISGHGNLGALAAAVQEFRPQVVVGSDREVARGWHACCPGFAGDFY
jgi:1-deoxy-D-xylulose 5-phosphate reductoisomerase